MSMERPDSSSGSGSGVAGFSWLAQRVTGVGLVVLLGFHFAVEHFIVGAANVTAQNTQARLSRGIIEADHIFNVTINIPAFVYQASALLLLAFSVHHGMYGVYNILLEQGLSERQEKAAKYFFGVLSVALFVQGVFIFLAFTTDLRAGQVLAVLGL
ncbi:MAG: hypothetical protein SV760_03645 [Halobacteria archaeon]|nr:hypothetical protein [Halobacteria archaeon]